MLNRDSPKAELRQSTEKQRGCLVLPEAPAVIDHGVQLTNCTIWTLRQPTVGASACAVGRWGCT